MKSESTITEPHPVKIQRNTKELISYIFSLTIFGTTVWLCAYNNHELLKWWYIIVMSLLLVIRVPTFFKRKWHHFFI
jgi:hypothetical protein